MKTARNLWPYGLILPFELFFADMTTVVTIAVAHRDNLIRENYYEQELDYQQHIDSAARARQAGATITCNAASNTVVITLPAGQLGEKLSGKIEFYRPSSSALDREFKLAPAADGTARGDSAAEITAYLRAGIDGFFTDDPAVGRAAVRAFTGKQ